MNVTQKLRLVFGKVKNIVVKGENTGNQPLSQGHLKFGLFGIGLTSTTQS